MSVSSEELSRLIDIKDEIKSLIEEAEDLLDRDTMVYNRAKSYWIPHILMQLDNEHHYLGGSGCTMQNTIDEMKESHKE